MERETITKGPYIVHSVEDNRDEEESQYVDRTHFYLGDARLWESEENNVGFHDVDESTDAMFVLYLYHPAEVVSDFCRFGETFPEPTTYQEAEDPVLREELRSTNWEVSNHHLWMTDTPLSLLRDENIVGFLIKINLHLTPKSVE